MGCFVHFFSNGLDTLNLTHIITQYILKIVSVYRRGCAWNKNRQHMNSSSCAYPIVPHVCITWLGLLLILGNQHWARWVYLHDFYLRWSEKCINAKSNKSKHHTDIKSTSLAFKSSVSNESQHVKHRSEWISRWLANNGEGVLHVCDLQAPFTRITINLYNLLNMK